MKNLKVDQVRDTLEKMGNRASALMGAPLKPSGRCTVLGNANPRTRSRLISKRTRTALYFVSRRVQFGGRRQAPTGVLPRILALPIPDLFTQFLLLRIHQFQADVSRNLRFCARRSPKTVAPRVGFEPTTHRLWSIFQVLAPKTHTADCSAVELPRHIAIFSFFEPEKPFTR